MSAIVAVLLTEAQNGPSLAADMLHAMPYRAPDGEVIWSEGAVSLGLGYMRTLPEDPIEPTIHGLGDLRLVAHARLDNRPFLLEALSLSSDASEGDILLHAYLKWGSDCPIHLLGDFAFIIYDESCGHLFAARDPMGVKPLFFRHDPSGLLMASEFRVLLAPGRPFTDLKAKGPISEHVANFVLHRQNTDYRVFYDGVSRLRAGHTLRFNSSDGLHTRRYWHPAEAVRRRVPHDPEIMRDLLMDSVRCRMRSAKPVAVLLSGGLDSSSIAVCANAVARAEDTGPVDTYSIVFDKTPTLNERPYIEAVLRKGLFRPHFLAMDGYAPFDGLSQLIASQARLFNAPAMIMSNRLHAALAADGFNVFLDGHGGDEIISHGTERLYELASEKQWRTLWRELSVLGRQAWGQRVVAFANLFLHYGEMRGSYRLRQLLSRHRRPPANTTRLAGPKLADTLTALPPQKKDTLNHLEVVTSVLLEEASEMLELAAALRGTEPRFPFYDRRLIEHCLSLPSQAKLNKGWSRFVLRRAMEGLLPRRVQWRRSKFNFAPHLAAGILTHHQAMVDAIVEDDVDSVSGYINLNPIRATYRRAKQNPRTFKGKPLLDLWRTVALSLWLRNEIKAD